MPEEPLAPFGALLTKKYVFFIFGIFLLFHVNLKKIFLQVCLQLKIREVRQKMMARPNSPSGGGNSSAYTAASASSAPGTPLSAPPTSAAVASAAAAAVAAAMAATSK